MPMVIWTSAKRQSSNASLQEWYGGLGRDWEGRLSRLQGKGRRAGLGRDWEGRLSYLLLKVWNAARTLLPCMATIAFVSFTLPSQPFPPSPPFVIRCCIQNIFAKRTLAGRVRRAMTTCKYHAVNNT